MSRIIKCSLGAVVFLLILEISLRVLLAMPFVASRRNSLDDLSWRRWWVHVHRSGQEMLYGFDAYDPTKGWLPRPNLRNVHAFGDKLLNTNSKGLRGADDYATDTRPDKLRIVILGDSFTFGDEVADSETYAFHLQQLLPDTDVINMGVHGYGHDQMLILLREEGVRYRPDVVILGFVQADMPRNTMLFRDYAKPRFTIDGGALNLLGSPVPPPENVLRWDWIRPRLYDLSSLVVHATREVTGLARREDERVTTRLLEAIVAMVRQIHAIPVFVYLPTPVETANPRPLLASEKFLFGVCREAGITLCFSLRPAFREEMARGTRFGSGRHWSPAGHRVIAETIRDHLITAGVVDCCGSRPVVIR